jgi:hypothetical protein
MAPALEVTKNEVGWTVKWAGTPSPFLCKCAFYTT